MRRLFSTKRSPAPSRRRAAARSQRRSLEQLENRVVLSADPVFSFISTPSEAQEGASFFSVYEFSDTFEGAEDYSYSVDWGDGVVDNGTQAGGDISVNYGTSGGADTTGSFNLLHEFADDGVYNASFTITDSSGAFSTELLEITVTNDVPDIRLIGGDVAEGETFELIMVNRDSGDFDAVTEWTIDWGDGQVETIYNPVPVNQDTGLNTRAYLATHDYADGENEYLIEVLFSDEDGDYDEQTLIDAGKIFTDFTFETVVENVEPELEIAALEEEALEGSPFVLELSSEDPGDDTISEWVIDWGDGVIETVLGDPSSVSHAYADDGEYEISASATDEDDTYDVFDTVTAVILNADPVLVTVGSSASEIGGAAAGETVTLSGTYSDPGVLDTHEITVDWGDGTAPETVAVSGGVFSLDHVYAEAGFYDVNVTLVDDDGGEDSAVANNAITGIALRDGALQIIGTGGNDFAKVYQHWCYSDTVKVFAHFAGVGYEYEYFDIADVDSIEMYLGGGDDIGYVSSRLSIDAKIDGGSGDDLLIGGSGDDILLGGDGYDTMGGGHGRDLLIGGNDGDVIFGESGEDILISGTTAFDNDSAALDSIMSEWTSSRSYNDRVDNLLGLGVGAAWDARLNDEVFLIANGEDATVFDDESTDWLVGGRGKDLYFDGDDDISFARWGEVVEDIEAEGELEEC
ncbi:PKD domain protein [Pseudobythopirellula maris]|uniref:PKD domain protein n=1 Tax=Pseudobythopirellula maris TaxID=2527991 RepID=A0A5C5ZN27_9BACT|nr:PKD domain-containing protein [Pseudobythopirellula maris]TWT88904.1 PKD domain protein [Pseudobythopirellula maris]